MLKNLIFLFGLSFFSVTLYCQEIEVVSSLNTSTDIKFQNAYGFGLSIQKEINTTYLMGLACHYNGNSAAFDLIDPTYTNPSNYLIEKIKAKSNRFSLRLNLQRILISNENVSLAIGPEVSYNFLWGNYNMYYSYLSDSNLIYYSKNYESVNGFGFGLISMIEVKKFLIPKLSLCFNIRPEIIKEGGMRDGGGANQGYTNFVGYTEFQIGLKYKIH